MLGVPWDAVMGQAVRHRSLAVRGGPVAVTEADGVVLLQRHGAARYAPAHRLDHHAHADALARAGVDRVLAISSVGSLRRDWPVGTVVVPDDFVGLAAQPDSRFVDARGHSVPGFEARWRSHVLEVWAEHAPSAAVDGGTYVQVSGPRFETPAEVRSLAAFADVVGMTVAAECVAMGERDLAYAAVCIVDNLANGLDERRLTVEEFEAGKAVNRAMLVATLPGVVAALVSDS